MLCPSTVLLSSLHKWNPRLNIWQCLFAKHPATHPGSSVCCWNFQFEKKKHFTSKSGQPYTSKATRPTQSHRHGRALVGL